MIILHLENQDVTRESLARLAGVKNDQSGDYEYLSTRVAAAARQYLQQGAVRAMVLDLGLNATWDNKHMIRVLRHLALDEEIADPQAPQTCESHGIALLAHQQKVPCALLTNYTDYGGGDPPLTAARLAEAFRAEEVFGKDEEGLQSCARWVRRHAGVVAS